jgi:D-alanyl-D-alanine carboxypeptidase
MVPRFLAVFVLLGALTSAATLAATTAKTPAKSTATAKPSASAGTYKGAVTIDAASGDVLFEDNADVIAAPASMTKLMTFAVLDDRIHAGALTLQTPVTVTAADSKIGGTQVWLAEKEVFPVEELVYAMMIQSANDAAHALARTAGGSVEAFVALMNAKARELGMTQTTFVTPHGLPPANRKTADGDLTTPRDFARLCRYLLLKTDVLKYSSVEKRDFRPDSPEHKIEMLNHDKLLGVAGVDGLKTGYTADAGYCLSSTAERDGRRLIVVIMGSFGPNGQIDLGKARDVKARELIELGFAKLPASSKFTGYRPSAQRSPLVAVGPASASPLIAVPSATADTVAPTVTFSLPSSRVKK